MSKEKLIDSNGPEAGDLERSSPDTMPRRGFLRKSAAVLASTASFPLWSGDALAQQRARGESGLLEQLIQAGGNAGRPILLRGGIVLTLDPNTGDFERADVLIEGKKISAVGPDLKSSQSALVVDVAGMIVMPGFVDTHHHQYETLMRSMLADGNLGLFHDGPKNYLSVIQGILSPAYLPDDARIGELVASLSQISAGVTTTVDTSQISLTPEHTDACIAGLRESGRRAVYAYSGGRGSKAFPRDIVRLRKQYFSSDDQLLTLALGGGPNAEQWKLARSVNAPTVSHIVGTRFGDLELMGKANLMGPDNEYIHCTVLSETVWKMIADSGGKVSIAPAIEMQMRHGMPAIQAALDRGIRPSLSVDVECNMTSDMFSIMRSAFTLQRALVNERAIAGEQNLPPLLTCRETIEMATIEGAKVAHLDHKIGTLTPGKEADIVVLATDRINVFPLNNVPGTIVTLMDTSNVDHVFIAGKVKKWKGTLVGIDLPSLRRSIEHARDGLLARARYPRDLFGSCCTTV